jgi:hypothetical protein
LGIHENWQEEKKRRVVRQGSSLRNRAKIHARKTPELD